MQIVLTATQNCEVAVTVKDRKGNAATVQDPSFASSDTAVLTVGPSATDPSNPLAAQISAVGPTGPALLTFTGDADLGEGVKPIIGTADVVVNAGEASVVEITAGTPTEQEPTTQGRGGRR